MTSVYNMLTDWARRTTTSFSELLAHGHESHDEEVADDGMAYRLKHWPDLPCALRTAPVLRTLSVMSHRNVNRRWILSTSKLSAPNVDALLARLMRQDALTVSDLSHYPAVPAQASQVAQAAQRPQSPRAHA